MCTCIGWNFEEIRGRGNWWWGEGWDGVGVGVGGSRGGKDTGIE